MIVNFGVLIPLAALVSCSLGKEITRAPLDDVEATRASSDDRLDPEEEIKNQVRALKRMRCKPVLQKILTHEHIPEYLEYHEAEKFEIFPEVLSVMKCDENCSYCNPKKVKVDGRSLKQGMAEVKSCRAKIQETVNYTIRATEKETNVVSYFHVPLDNDILCKCEFKKPRRHRHGHRSV